MDRITRLDVLIWLPRLAFLAVAAIFLGKYLTYLAAVVPFPYDWEPTDGDHLNFAHRLAQGLAIYLPLKDGQVLSIYNPLFHSVVAMFGGAHADLGFARSVSFLFWLSIPLVVLWHFRNRWGFFHAAIAALLIWLPAEPGMLIDIVQVNPNSTMAFIFLATLLYATKCAEQPNTAWWEWLTLGAIAAFCYLAKQQGLIALVVTISYLLLQRSSWRGIALTILGSLVVFAASTGYLELMNSGEYLRATMIDLRKIMITTPGLAQVRLKEFLFDANFYFFVCVIYSFYVFLVRERKIKELSIWQISFLLHIPFLLAILGNGGGGPNYFLSMWISIVLLSIEIVKKVEGDKAQSINVIDSILIFAAVALWGKNNNPAYAVMVFWVVAIIIAVAVRNGRCSSLISAAIASGKNPQERNRLVFSNAILFALLVNSYVGITTTTRELGAISVPTPALEKKMQEYYRSVAALVAGRQDMNVLTHRNIGALVSTDVKVTNEGCTMFSYAWNSPLIFDRSAVLIAIRERRFDLITTGLQEYPKEVKFEIDMHYRPVLTQDVNLYFGKMGPASVFVPNAN